MLICPKCQSTNMSGYKCQNCSHEVELVDETPFFHPESVGVFEDHSEESLISIDSQEQTHFWFRTRFNYILKTFRQFISSNDKCLEIGGGTGGVSKYLSDHNYNMAVGEIQPIGLKFAKKKGISDRFQFDLFKPIFKNEYDCICLFDVLEHLDDEKAALESLKTMLTDDGKVVLTVPAHMWLWNRRDLIENHKRRYEASELKNLFEQNGFKILKVQYFFVAILPLLFLRALMTKNDKSEVTEQERLVSIRMNPILNFILYWVTTIEHFFLRFISFPAGGSLILVAQKSK